MSPRKPLAPVLSLACTKGGVGKSTLAFSLACEFARRLAGVPAAGSPDTGSPDTGTPDAGMPAYRVIVIDADPNGTVAACLRHGKPEGVGAENADADTLLPTLTAARRQAELVIVDLEGTANQAMLYACGKSSLVLVPAQPSKFDVAEAMKTHRVVQQAADMVERKIPAHVILTRTPVLRQQVTGHSRAQFARRGLPILATEFMERTAFRKLTFTGRPVWESDPKGMEGGATLNVAAIADEIAPLLGFQAAAREEPVA